MPSAAVIENKLQRGEGWRLLLHVYVLLRYWWKAVILGSAGEPCSHKNVNHYKAMEVDECSSMTFVKKNGDRTIRRRTIRRGQ